MIRYDRHSSLRIQRRGDEARRAAIPVRPFEFLRFQVEVSRGIVFAD